MAATQLYPQVSFTYSVTVGGATASFSEVSGLAYETTPIEYRAGDSLVYAPEKMPGLMKFGDISLKKGVFKKDSALYDWFNSILLNTVDRKSVIISLLDETHSPVCTWTLTNAWVSKYDGGAYKSTANEVAIETATIVHEGLTMKVN
jgi:phage tail-like protein